MVIAMTDIQTDSRYPMIEAILALLMNTWKNIDNEICDRPQPANIMN